MDLHNAPTPALPSLPAGGIRAVLEAAANALRHDGGADMSALALVLETAGSTYVRRGALALFDAASLRAGWLSGGCLEPDIALRARDVAQSGRIDWMDIDTRADEDLLSGSAPGCRGHLRMALLPLRALGGWSPLLSLWCDGAGALHIDLRSDGTLAARIGDTHAHATLPAEALPWDGTTSWTLQLPRPPSVAVFGAGPETPLLLPLLRALGLFTTLVERRPRWRDHGALADRAIELPPEQALAALPRQYDAALVMHHHFELDREALAALSGSPIGFIGLLGPVRRREDLFRVLPPQVRQALSPRLHSPVGLNLGGHGPEAIALSIAAQLQSHLYGPAT